MHIKSYCYVSRWRLLRKLTTLITCGAFRVKMTLNRFFYFTMEMCNYHIIGPVFSHAAGICNYTVFFLIMRSLEWNLCLANLCLSVCSKYVHPKSMHLEIRSKLFSKKKMAVFCCHLANKSEQREIIQCMPVNDQVHITKKLRVTFTVLIFFFFFLRSTFSPRWL